MSGPPTESRAIPAHLDFLAIYNPSLGTTDQTIDHQIVYYSSAEVRRRRDAPQNLEPNPDLREENNEQLRQIGLAQGMVEFGRGFSNGGSVDSVETKKSRIILHELESGWWILASIKLTAIPASSKVSAPRGDVVEDPKTEYSSREVKPAILLLGDILRAHSTFLLHHASSMSALFVRTRRSKFVDLLGRYWDTFISTWSVLMHGNPACNLYGGIKIAACGELGIGVGEEERGSGEREVLEGFIGRIDGLIDVIVSRFGELGPTDDSDTKDVSSADPSATTPWLGCGNEPVAEDGVIFLGSGALSRKSIRDISHWIEDLYRWGSHAYGIVENPSSTRRAKKSNARKHQQQSMKNASFALHTREKPRPVYSPGVHGTSRDEQGTSDYNTISSSLELSQSRNGDMQHKYGASQRRLVSENESSSIASIDSETPQSNKIVQYLKLGYGTHWSLGGNTQSRTNSISPSNGLHKASIKDSGTTVTPDNSGTSSNNPSDHSREKWEGRYLVGLLGHIEDRGYQISRVSDSTASEQHQYSPKVDNERVVLRTLTVELERKEDARAEADISIDLGNSNMDPKSSKRTSSERTGTSNTSFESQDRNKTKKLRVVVYVYRPFIFVFLFELRTEVLSMSSLYRSLHYQIGPLIKPLVASTTFRALKPEIASSEYSNAPIYDLIWDPQLLTVTSSIPNIPSMPHTNHPHGHTSMPPWSRLEALSTHMQIISTYVATIPDRSEQERTCKSSRGWWVVWTRIPQPQPEFTTSSHHLSVPGTIAEDSSADPAVSKRDLRTSRGTSTFGSSTISGPAHPFLEAGTSDLWPKDKEIFLVRRSSDNTNTAKSASRLAPVSSIGRQDGWLMGGPGKLAQGIGVDTKRYIEALLNA